MADGFIRHPFDEANGVRTSGLVAGRHLRSGHLHDRHATAYYGVAPSVFQALIRRWRRTGPAAPIELTSFVDVGAGWHELVDAVEDGVVEARLLEHTEVVLELLHRAGPDDR